MKRIYNNNLNSLFLKVFQYFKILHIIQDVYIHNLFKKGFS